MATRAERNIPAVPAAACLFAAPDDVLAATVSVAVSVTITVAAASWKLFESICGNDISTLVFPKFWYNAQMCY